MNMKIDNERFLNVSYVKKFICYKCTDLIKRKLSTRLGVECETEFSSVLRRQPLEISIPCAFESISNIAKAY